MNYFFAYIICLLSIGERHHFFKDDPEKIDVKKFVATVLQKQILAEAAWALEQEPITVTAEYSPRSAGGKHDFFSEGDYWWPNPAHVDSPYIQKDGMTNPQNFTAHRLAMIRFSKIMGALASAYQVSKDVKYLKHALKHCNAWFIDQNTRMNPSLLFAQAIKGRFTGRGIGIIDTIQLMEVAQALIVMEIDPSMDPVNLKGFKQWFADYLLWLTTHAYGKAEMNAENNHGTCWVMQVACFAKFTQNEKIMQFCRERYKNILLPNQMEKDGSFPRELKRTKPYGYAIFNLDAMTMICQILSIPNDNLWNYTTPDGKSIKQGITYLYPYIKDKESWPFTKDVMYWDQWPVAQPFLVMGANAFSEKKWLYRWEQLEHTPLETEIIRNLPVRHPLIWLN